MEIPPASSTSVDNQIHQENSGGSNIKTENSEPIPRLPLPDCMKNSKSELINNATQKQIHLEFKSESQGDPHILRWSATLIVNSKSTISVFPIFKTKKDAEKAVAYKANMYGLEVLANKETKIDADRQRDLDCLKQCHKQEGHDWDELVANSYTNAPLKSTSSSASAVEAAHYYREILDPSTDQSIISSGTIALPFPFPASNSDLPDLFSLYCSKCMQSLTRQRFLFAFGNYSVWRAEWMKGLESCFANKGVVICTTQEALDEVEKVVQDNPAFRKECSVCKDTKDIPLYPRSCTLLSSVLQEIDLNGIFPTERPLLIVDNSKEWSATWQWLIYCPTFHIVSYCFFDSIDSSPLIKIGTLRDAYNCDLFTQM